MNEPRRHHVVPEFYLRRFAVNDQVQLAKRSNLGSTFPNSVVKATVQTDFYAIDTEDGRSTDVETFFANVIEPKGARAIRRIVDEGFFPPAPGLRRDLATFCAFQFVRGDAFRGVLRDSYDAIAKSLGALVTPEIAREHLTEADGTAPSDEEIREFVAFAHDAEAYTVRPSSGWKSCSILCPTSRSDVGSS